MRERLSLITVALLPIVVSRALPEPAQDAPRFERAECDYPVPANIPRDVIRECGYLAVPENRARPAGRKYRLAVVVYRAKEPSNEPPLLLLHGGPGGAGGTHFPWSGTFQTRLAQRRDIVAFDMRGVSASEPKLCPEFDAEAAWVKGTRREWEQVYRAAVRRCVARLDSAGIDRTAFGADINARDAIDLRRALGYSRWDIYGVSYGTLVAQELLRLDSSATHAAVLVSGVPLGATHFADRVLGQQQNLQTAFAQCATQPACKRAFPTLQADFDALYSEFSAKPAEIPVINGGQTRTVTLDGERFIMEMRQGLGQPANVRRAPMLVHELRHGDRAAALRHLLGTGVIPAWDALSHLVGCNEYGASYRDAVAATMPRLTPAYRTVADDFREHCDLWLPQPAHQSDTRPIVSDVPTLVVFGEFDPTHVNAASQRMTARLKNSYSYTFPGLGHAGPTVGCYGSVVHLFLENPARAPDTSCMSRMPGLRYKTTPGYAPTTTFVIGGTAAGRLAGTWETNLAGGPDLTFEIESNGNNARGFLIESMLPIFDGRIDSTTVHFKVKTADSARVISFTGTLRNDQLEFARAAALLMPREPPGPGILGTLGPSTLIARRVPVH